MATVLAALIGAFFGSIGAVAFQEWLRARRERREHREVLVHRYLFQLQDAVEALWHRVYNVRHEGGKGAMTPAYQASTTVYALGRVLAAERVLTLEGVYPQRSWSRTSMASGRAPIWRSSSGTWRERRVRPAGLSGHGPRSEDLGRTRGGWMAGLTCWGRSRA
jgi:hypothetical protein